MKFSIKDFFSKCDQIRRKLSLCSVFFRFVLSTSFVLEKIQSHLNMTLFQFHVSLWVGKNFLLIIIQPGTYSKPSQTSKTELTAKIAFGF